MKYLRDVLNGPNHKNVKIFIVLAILNCQRELKPHAHAFIDPLCKVCISDQIWKVPMNYLVKEILRTLLLWYESATPDVKIMPQIIQHIVKSIFEQDRDHSRGDLLENNLQLLDCVLELWKGQPSYMPVNFIMSELEKSSKVAILICKIALNQKILTVQDEQNPNPLLKAFCKLLQNTTKQVYAEAAEAIGALFK